MKVRSLACLPWLMIALGAVAAGTDLPAGFIEQQRQLVRQFQKKNDIPGLSVALFDHERILWIEGFGHQAQDRDRPIDPGTIFGVQSISKTLTTVGVLTAVRDGLLDLDVPVSKYLPDFAVNSCYEKDSEDRITLRMLLGNTAGFTHEAPVGNNYDATSPSYDAHYRSISSTWLKFPAGTRYSYSNLGFDLAAEMIERTSGMAFPEYLRRKICEPLGMASTTVDTGIIRANVNRSGGSAFGVKAFPLAVPMIGAGGVYTCASDLARFVQCHLAEGKSGKRPFLPPALLEEMYTPLMEEDYGLGIALTRENGTYSLNHNGAGFGFGASMKWFPEYRIGCVILTNAACLPYQTASKILENAITAGFVSRDTSWMRGFSPFRTYDRNYPAGKSDVPWPPVPGDTTWHDGWSRYPGTYRMMDGGGIEFDWYARIARWFGYRMPNVKVYRNGRRLCLSEYNGSEHIGERPLTEYRPGLFFTPYGEALEFRRSIATYRNIRLVK